MSCLLAGTKVEGILRQSADVEEVDRRVQEYEQGTNNGILPVNPLSICMAEVEQTLEVLAIV